jgi:hypothetical protein
MKRNNIKISKWIAIAGLLVAVLAMMSRPAYALNDGMALLVQQSPVEGGVVTPELGVHKFESGSEIILMAVPKPGYQFIHWIGDVADSTSSRTSVYLDSPKIIIAVFERSEFDFLVTDELADIRPGGGMHGSPADYGKQGYSGGGGGFRGQRRGIGGIPQPPQPEPNNDFPTPPPDNDINDFPVPPPIPEPATILLFGLGALILSKSQKKMSWNRK